MLKNHAVATGILCSMLLFSVAVFLYPGGSYFDPYSQGFDWQYNYLSNLFNKTAINGMPNSARFWAVGGMFFLCLSFALFFIRFTKNISSKSGQLVIKYAGIASMVCAFLTVSPLHDLMISLSVSLALITLFYITIFLFKSENNPLKVLGVITLIVSYFSSYIYFTQNFIDLLPLMQKITLLINLSFVLSVEYLLHQKVLNQN